MGLYSWQCQEHDMPFSSQWFSNPSTDDYTIDNSCSFDATNDYLYKTLGTASNRKVFTISCWVKRSKLDSGGTNQGILSAGTSGNDRGGLFFVGDEIHFSFSYGGTWYELKSSAKYRDTSGWMHIVVRVNTDTGTAADRTKIYVNGSEIAYATSGYVPEDAELPINDAVEQVIGAYSANKAANDMFGGYIAEMYFIDNGALTPSSFGETSSTTGQWIPKDYTGSYGDNGYRLSFGTSGAMGDDTSGEENDFSLTGISANNQFTDSPTKNFPTWDPQSMQANISVSEANLIATNTSNTQGLCFSTLVAKTGKKYYAEFTLNASPQLSNQYPAIGVIGIDVDMDGGNNIGNSSFFGYLPNGNKLTGGSSSSYGNTYGNGDIIGIALDLDNQKIYFSKNGTYQNSGDPAAGSNAAFTNLVAGTQYRLIRLHLLVLVLCQLLTYQTQQLQIHPNIFKRPCTRATDQRNQLVNLVICQLFNLIGSGSKTAAQQTVMSLRMLFVAQRKLYRLTLRQQKAPTLTR